MGYMGTYPRVGACPGHYGSVSWSAPLKERRMRNRDFCHPRVLYVNDPFGAYQWTFKYKITHRTQWSRLEVQKLFRSWDIFIFVISYVYVTSRPSLLIEYDIHILHWWKFIPPNFLQYKGSWAWWNFIQWKFPHNAIQYNIFQCILPSICIVYWIWSELSLCTSTIDFINPRRMRPGLR